MKLLIHKFIEFLLRVSKSKFKLVEPTTEFINIQRNETQIHVIQTDCLIPHKLLESKLSKSVIDAQIDKEVERRLMLQIKKGGFIKYSSTEDDFRESGVVFHAEMLVGKKL